MPFVKLVTQAQLEDRIGAITLTRMFDEDNDSEPDIDAVDALIRDGSSKVLSALGPVYDTDLLTDPQLAEVVRLTLDACQAYAAQRHPELMRSVDGYKMMDQVDKGLSALRKGVTNLGIKTPPEPAANQGGDVDSGDPCDETPRAKLFLDGTGDF